MRVRLLILCASAALASCQVITPRTWDLPSDIKTLQINGYDMAYRERGSGAPLVLVHGTLADYRVWTAQMEPLSRDFRAIAVSLRHFYPERWNGSGDDFSMRQHADDLATFIKTLNAGPVHLVGHSRGSNVALHLMKMHPELVRTLTLADPTQIDDLMPSSAGAAIEADRRGATVNAALARLREGDVDDGLDIFAKEVAGPSGFKAFPEAQKGIWRDNAWSISSLTSDYREPYSCTDARRIKVPVLFVTGEKSPKLYGLMHAALQQCVSQYEKVTIARAAHPMNRANPQAFNAALLAFLRKHATN
jgi:pimeloyl-ACP methyl ester carboxylesterase